MSWTPLILCILSVRTPKSEGGLPCHRPAPWTKDFSTLSSMHFLWKHIQRSMMTMCWMIYKLLLTLPSSHQNQRPLRAGGSQIPKTAMHEEADEWPSDGRSQRLILFLKEHPAIRRHDGNRRAACHTAVPPHSFQVFREQIRKAKMKWTAGPKCYFVVHPTSDTKWFVRWTADSLRTFCEDTKSA